MAMNNRLLRPKASGYVAPDADARAYLTAVRSADGSALEVAVQQAINDFVVGCKADGIWSAIKASCILMGARTLSGALTPLVGAAPINNNFVSGDYNRKTGLKGDGTNKTLNSNRNNNVDGQDDFHAAVWVREAGTTVGRLYFGAGSTTAETGASNFGPSTTTTHFFRCRTSNVFQPANYPSTGLVGISRSTSTSFVSRANGGNTTHTATSQTPTSANLFVFSATNSAFPTNARFAFYSIGSFLTLATLEARLSTLYTAIEAAIP